MAERKTYTAEDFKGCNGRRVLVEGVIEITNLQQVADVLDQEGDVRVRFASAADDGLTSVAWCGPSAIVEILPEEIKEGDRVKPARGASERAFGDGSIIAISGPRAWVECSRGGHHFALLSDLTLVERGQ